MKPTHALLLAAALQLPLLALAQHAGHDASHAAPAAQAPTDALPWAEAEVRRIDSAAGKISLRHGEIRNLDMPPMTMVFQLSDPSRLSALKEGDKVRFTADKLNGAYTVLQIEKAP